MRTKALDEGNCAAARPGGFRGEADKTGRAASRNKKLESKRRAHEQKQGVPNLQASWIAYHYPPKKEPGAQAPVTSPAT
jgi:hypothetical protein